MRIQKIVCQHRRDFQAVYECEHCGATQTGKGYDDSNFHNTVVPQMKCKQCGKQAPDGYRPLTTKYPDWVVV